MTTPPAADRRVPALVVTVLVGYALLAYAAIAPGLNPVGALLGLVLTLGVVAVQVGYVSRPGVARSREWTALALLALACLVYVPVVALGVGWIAFAGFLAGSLLVLLPPRVGVAGAAVVVVSVGLLAGLLGGAPLLPVVSTMVGTAVTGLVVGGLTHLWELTAVPVAGEPQAAESVAAEPVAGEPQPEPDVAPEAQGAAVESAVKPEAVEPGAPEVGEREEPEAAEPAEPAADLPDPPALAVALGTARAELEAAGIELSVLGGEVELPEETATLFVALLRVAVGHAARQPDAASCHVTVVRRAAEARIVVTHDGATADPDPEDFEALGERFDVADGSVLAERDEQEFTVDGRLPVSA